MDKTMEEIIRELTMYMVHLWVVRSYIEKREWNTTTINNRLFNIETFLKQ
jgi:hypothetical protein